MNVWLTWEKKTIFGGTYFPARDGDRGVGMGFLNILERLTDIYKTDREKVEKTGNDLVDAIGRTMTI
ncbi:MAG: DUF255 domain-containing protein [Desulfobacterium sp.]|nr:DUF255 domain-containing protein [Desulfobacterium sp.]